MCRRVLSAWLIILALLIGNGAPVRARSVHAQVGEERITPEEEREATQIAERFSKGFEEKSNLSSLIDELYVKDFDARLRANPGGFFYLVKVEPDVLAKADGQDLKRLYSASLNFIYAGGFLYGINAYDRKLRGEEQEDDDPPLEKLLPPEAIAVMKSDPLVAQLLAEDEEKERARNSAQASESEKGIDKDRTEEAGTQDVEIRSLERLRGYTSTLEKASLLMRAHIKTVQGPHNLAELISAFERLATDEKSDECQGMCPRVYILREEFFGEPEGTRLICVNVLPFHMDLVRVDGRLRILNVYLMDD